MSHFALINEYDKVEQVIVAEQDFVDTLEGEWIQTSYNTIGGVHILGGTPLRMNYAGIGFTYDRVRDAFIPVKPLPSWVLNQNTLLWEAPIPMPNDGKVYDWDESTVSWKELTQNQQVE